MSSSTTPLISVSELARSITDEKTIVLDATVGAAPTDPHIPGAQMADLDGAWSDHDSPWPHTKPQVPVLEAELRRLGVHADSHVVIYERNELFAAPRIWWLLKAFGFDNVSILDGGLLAWENAHLPTTTEPTASRDKGTVSLNPRDDMIIDEEAVCQHLAAQDRRILDARSTARFEGREAEPRPHLRSGHIPTSGSVPYTSLQRDGWILSDEELQRILGPLIDERPIVTSCGSGVTACVIALALDIIGRKDVAVYDGSWAQWGREDGPEIATGPEKTVSAHEES
ncbi:MAG: sulfurtransferase [Actinomycetaceae bacterium]|nr:sulfurtransferase [Actinomycetaceae bacterium]